MKYLLTFALVMSVLVANSQDLQSIVAQSFNSYHASHRALKTAVTFSQDKYVPGDTAFFHAWFLTETGQLVGGEQILNMDMIDSDGTIVQHILFRAKDGVGANQLIIPSNTQPGVYIMSVYSDAMKGVDAAYAIRKPITIVKQNEVVAGDMSNRPVTSEYIRVDTTAENISIQFSIPDQKNKDLAFAVTSGGQLYYAGNFDLKKRDAASIRLPRKGLLGWNQVSVIDDAMTVVASHQFYLPSHIRCSVDLDQTSFITGQPIAARVSTSDSNGKGISLPLSISVVNANLPIVSSDKQQVPPPPVPWQTILSNAHPGSLHPPGLITMYGEAYFAGSTDPVKPGTVINVFMKRNHFAFETPVGKDGKFEMVFLDFYGQDQMFYYATNGDNELPDIRIRWTDKPMAHQPSARSRQLAQVDRYSEFIEKKRMIDRSYNYFRTDTAVRKNEDQSLDKVFEKLGDVVNLHEYKLFPTMGEMVLEFIPRLRKVPGKQELRVNLSEPNLKTLGNPLFIIDNFITKDGDTFLSLKPGDVVSIRVIYDAKDLNQFMPVSRNGIVVVKTKNESIRRIEEHLLTITGLSDQIQFVQQSNSKPEFRSTLHWALMSTDQSGVTSFSFPASDDIGKMRIRVTGVYAGEMFTVEREVTVNYK